MTSRRHRIGPDARSGGESWVRRPFEPLRQRRWIDSVPPAVGRKGHACFVIAPRRSIPLLLRRDASHARPFRPIVRPLVFRQSLVFKLKPLYVEEGIRRSRAHKMEAEGVAHL